MAEWTATEVTQLVVAAGGTAAAIVGAVAAALARSAAAKTRAEAERIRTEVQTLNHWTIGQLAARSETRRILRRDEADRSDEERQHLRDSPPD